MKQPDPIALLRAQIGPKPKLSMRAFARKHSVCVNYVSGVLRGTKTPGPKILAVLGLEATVERVVTYRRVRGSRAA